LTEKILADAERAAADGRNRSVIRGLAELRGRWFLEQGQETAAIASLQHAIAMARAVGREAEVAESALALVHLRNGDCDGARAGAERLDEESGMALLYLARIWAELGEPERAIATARRAHAWAVADGEPYVYRDELTHVRKLLSELGADLPEVPVHDPASLPKFEWEPKLREVIAEVEAKNAEFDAAVEAERHRQEEDDTKDDPNYD
jgi:tetratricopeptide (TPR) repeat protein